MAGVGLLLVALVGCSQSPAEQRNAVLSSSRPTSVVVLPYAAFGPPVLAYETLGKEWYQWNPVGECDPNAPRDNVLVVVYRGISLDDAKQRFPVVTGVHDFRYLDFSDAIAYLSQHEREFAGDDDFGVGRRLRETRRQIVDSLGEEDPS